MQNSQALKFLYGMMDQFSLLYHISHADSKLILVTYCNKDYRKISNIRCNEFQNLNVSHLILQLSLPNPLKPGVK